MMVDKLMKIYPSPKAKEGLREGLGCQGHPQLAPVPPEHLLVSHPHPGALALLPAGPQPQGAGRRWRRLDCVALLPGFLKPTCTPALSSPSSLPVSEEASGLLFFRAAFLKLHMQTHGKVGDDPAGLGGHRVPPKWLTSCQEVMLHSMGCTPH